MSELTRASRMSHDRRHSIVVVMHKARQRREIVSAIAEWTTDDGHSSFQIFRLNVQAQIYGQGPRHMEKLFDRGGEATSGLASLTTKFRIPFVLSKEGIL
ncbi:transcription regulator [Moniliophthora roreri]|nr:transcription regulator [Moniliophthora roreri]